MGLNALHFVGRKNPIEMRMRMRVQEKAPVFHKRGEGHLPVQRLPLTALKSTTVKLCDSENEGVSALPRLQRQADGRVCLGRIESGVWGEGTAPVLLHIDGQQRSARVQIEEWEPNQFYFMSSGWNLREGQFNGYVTLEDGVFVPVTIDTT